MVTKYRLYLYSKHVIKKLVTENQLNYQNLVIQTRTVNESLDLLKVRKSVLQESNDQLFEKLAESIGLVDKGRQFPTLE